MTAHARRLMQRTFSAHAQHVLRNLQETVFAQTDGARGWHRSNLSAHGRRYCADLDLITDLAPAGPMLDIGSAPCHMTGLLQLAGYPVVGLDLAPQRVGPLIHALNLDVRQCDVEREKIPFADGYFAGALLCETFEHLRVDPGLVLSETCRVLAPGGFLLLTTPNVYSLPSLARFLLGRSVADPLSEFGKLRALGHMGHVREYSAREVRRFVEASGFTVDWLDFRFDAANPSRKKRILNWAYYCVPRRFHRDIVLVARKTTRGAGPGLLPLL